MEESRIIVEPFDPKFLLRPIFEYRRPFLDRVYDLGKTPASFPEIMAKVHAHVSARMDGNIRTEELRELLTLLPDIKQSYYDPLPLLPVCDLFNEAQIDALLLDENIDEDSPQLQPLSTQIERLSRISEELSDDGILSNLLSDLIDYYTAFREKLCAKGADRKQLLSPKPTLSGIDLSCYEISHQEALQLLCRNEYGGIERASALGRHPTVRVNGLYCKNMIHGDTLGSGRENAVGQLFQIFNRRYRVAAPVTLLAVDHVKIKNLEQVDAKTAAMLKYNNNKPYMGGIIQVAMLSEGELFQHVLELQIIFKQWCAAYKDKTVLADILRYSDMEDNLEKLKNSSGLIGKEKDNISLYLRVMKNIIKDYTPEKAIEDVPYLLDKIDSYSFCSAIFVNILANSSDMKADNIMLCWKDSPESGQRIYYFEFVDSDIAFNHTIIKGSKGHYVTFQCILLFFNLDKEFDADLRAELLSEKALYFVLAWMQSVSHDEHGFNESVGRRVFSESNLFRDGQPLLDRPIKFNESTLKRVLNVLKRAQKILSEHKKITVSEFFEKLSPIVSRYYTAISAKHKESPLEAYLELCRYATIEALCPDNLPNLDRYNYSHNDAEIQATLSTGEAVAHFIRECAYFEDAAEEFRLLEFVGQYFPLVNQLKYERNELNQRLLSVADYMLPNALLLLLRCGADINAVNEKGESLLYKILGKKNLELTPSSQEILAIILSQNRVEVHGVSKSENTPLTVFVRNAVHYSVDFINTVIGLFRKKRTDFNQMTAEGTALDCAVEVGSIALLSALVENGGYAFKNLNRLISFVLKQGDDRRIIEATEILSVLNPRFQFKRGLLVISSAKEDVNHVVSIEGDSRKKRYLHNDVSAQLFDEKGRFRREKMTRLGDGFVINITVNGELLFHAVVYPGFSNDEVPISRLHQVFGSYGYAYSELYECNVNGAEPFPLLLMGAVIGDPLAAIVKNDELKREVFSNIDKANITKLLLIHLFLSQSGTPENIIVTPLRIKNKVTYIVKLIFCKGNVSSQNLSEDLDAEVRFSFLRPLMSVELDPGAVEEILSLDITKMLSDWLDQLFVYELSKDGFQFLSSEKFSALSAPILKTGFIKHAYVLLKALSDVLRNKITPDFKGEDFLSYSRSLFAPRLEKIEPRQSPREKTIETFRGLISPRKVGIFKLKKESVEKRSLEENVAGKKVGSLGKSCSVTSSRLEFEEIARGNEVLASVKDQVKRGNFDRFHKLPLDFLKQEAINSLVWSDYAQNVRLRDNIFKEIECSNIRFTKLKLVNCHIRDDHFLKGVFQKSPGLISIDLSGSQNLGRNLFPMIAEFCPNIEEIIVDRTLVVDINITKLANLRLLSAQDCMKLQKCRLPAKNLISVSFKSSPVLRKIKMIGKANMLSVFNINYCPLLEAAAISQCLSVAPMLRDFRHLGVKDFNSQSFTRFVLQKKTVHKETLASLVNNGLLNLSGQSVSERHLRYIIAQLSSDQRVMHFHKALALKAIDFRGCSINMRRAVAQVIAAVPRLDTVLSQFQLKPVKACSIPLLEKTLSCTIKKIFSLPTGTLLFLYDSADYEAYSVNDNTGLKCLSKGSLGRQLTDADLLPSGDVLICSDGKARLLNTSTWLLEELPQYESYLQNNILFCKVVGTSWLVLGGAHLMFIEITERGFLLSKTSLNVNIKAIALTPNSKVIVAQSASVGTILWSVDGKSSQIVGKEYSASITTVVAIDDITVLLRDALSGKELILNPLTGQIKPSRILLGVDFGVMAPGGFVVLGGSQCTDLMVFNPRSKAYQTPFKGIIDGLSPRLKQQVGEPCFTASGDLILNLGSSALLVNNQFQTLSLVFIRQLPASISLRREFSQGHGHHLILTHDRAISFDQDPILTELSQFITEFFSGDQFVLIHEANHLIISRIPSEEICIYHKMFESMIAYAREFQSAALLTEQKSVTPRLTKDSATNSSRPSYAPKI